MHMEQTPQPRGESRIGDPFYTELLSSLNAVAGLSAEDRQKLKGVIDRYGDSTAFSERDLAQALNRIVLAAFPEGERAHELHAITIAEQQKNKRGVADASKLTAAERALVILHALLEARGTTRH